MRDRDPDGQSTVDSTSPATTTDAAGTGTDDDPTPSAAGGRTKAADGGVEVDADEPSPQAGEATDATDSAEDFDPVGTVVLIAIYMAIVVGMWIFTYFVEFLGRGVTIVG